jgi:type I restriction enzyme S subunit
MVMSDLPNGRALAKAFYVNDEAAYAVNQRVCILSPFATNARFMYYLLDRNPHFMRYDDGVNQTHLPNAAFEKFKAHIPPLPEQERIAGFLDKVTQKFDELTAHAISAMELLAERRSALVAAAVTGKIDVRGAIETKAA